jgi:hypothetical protein
MRFVGLAVLGALVAAAACTGGDSDGAGGNGDSPSPITFDVRVDFNWYGPPGDESVWNQHLEEHLEDRDEVFMYLTAHAEDVEQLVTTAMFPDWANPLLAGVLTEDS